MSQQGGSSMVSSSIPNSQVKYQKALKEISKLINTNKILKSESEQRQHILTTELSNTAMRCEELAQKYEQSQNEKRRMQEFMEELQDTNQDLRKECQTLQREQVYLNDVLTEQNAQLKKLSVFKDDKGISQLLRSYEQRQHQHKEEIFRLQQHVAQLKTTIDRIQEDLMQQTQMRQRYQDQYNIIGLQINKYRELNNYLMDKNEHILGDDRNRNDRGMMSQHEIEAIVVQLKRQLQLLRNHQYHNEDMAEKQYVKNYELLLQEKNTFALELARTKDQLAISQQKIKEMYQFEETMSTALARSEILIEQNNMLKNRITILQSKEIIDSAGFDQDSDLKVFEEKINYMMANTDPANTIKNSDDNAHFVQMKSYISDLQAKLQSVIEQKQLGQKKYKSLKLKFSKKAEQNIILEESHKLLKGKLEGYERLAEKLNYELEKSIEAHENEIVKMVAISNNLVGKKVEQSKTASAFMKSQFDLQLQKAERIEKTLSQQVETFRLQNSTLKIRLSDVEQKHRQSSELLQMYQTKLNELSGRYRQLQQENTSINQKAIKYEQLYQEEKARHQTILIQKQSVSSKLNLVSDQLNQRTYSWEEAIRQKQANYEGQIKRSRLQIQRHKQQLDSFRQQNKRLSTQVDHHRLSQNKTFSSIKQQNTYLKELQAKLNQVKHLNHLLQTELISLRHKATTFDQLKTHLEHSEYQLTKKNHEFNDTKRHNINLKNQLQVLQNNIADLTDQNNQLLSDNNTLKAKLYHPPAMPTSTPKQLQARKTVQRLHQQIAMLQSAVRDQKRISSRHLNELHNQKEQIQRLQDIISKNKHRQQSLLQNLSTNNNQLIALQDQLFEFKSKYSQTAHTANNIGAQLDSATQSIAQINEELNSTKAKLTTCQANYDHLLRDLNTTKHYVQEADKMLKRLSTIERLQWEQQRQKDNLSALIQSLNKIIKKSESLHLSNNSSNQEYSFVPASSFGNLQSNLYTQASSAQNYNRIQFVGGSFANQEQTKANIVTNDTFRGYPGSGNSQSITNVNFSADSFGQPHQAGTLSSGYRPFEEV